MNRIGIITNITRDTELLVTKSLISYLEEKGIKPFILNNIGNMINRQDLTKSEEFIFSDCKLLIVLGGDGTILASAKKAAANNIPIVGINVGSLGYLTDVEKTDFTEMIDRVLNNQYHLEKRIMLDANVDFPGNKKSGLALNDCCIKCESFNMLRFNLFINDDFVDTYNADGIVIATPTGSTGYNLSAGGPILIPDGRMIAVTPICPHSLSSRPIVVSFREKIKVQTISRNAIVDLDGQHFATLKPGQTVEICKSQQSTTIIKTNGLNFYDILRKKL